MKHATYRGIIVKRRVYKDRDSFYLKSIATSACHSSPPTLCTDKSIMWSRQKPPGPSRQSETLVDWYCVFCEGKSKNKFKWISEEGSYLDVLCEAMSNNTRQVRPCNRTSLVCYNVDTATPWYVLVTRPL